MLRISSVAGSPLRLFSDGNFSVNINTKTRNTHTHLALGRLTTTQSSSRTKIFQDESGLKVQAGMLEVRDPNGRVLFSSSSGETEIGSDRVRLTGPAGLSVR